MESRGLKLKKSGNLENSGDLFQVFPVPRVALFCRWRGGVSFVVMDSKEHETVHLPCMLNIKQVLENKVKLRLLICII